MILSIHWELFADEANFSQHTDEYAVYSSGAEIDHFLNEDTGIYRNWRDLSDQGLIQGEGWTHWKNVSNPAA